MEEENKIENKAPKIEVKKLKKKKTHKVHIINMILLIIIVALAGLSFYKISNLENGITGSVTLDDSKPTGTSDVKLDFYVMSYCPYGNQAEEGIEPVYRLLKDKVDFNPHYVIYENYRGGGADYCIEDGKYCSMHGIQELNQNHRELCVAKYMGMGKYFDFVLEMNKKCNYKNADTCWEQVAKDLKLDTKKIKECEEKESAEFAANDFKLNQQLGVRGSPSVFINDVAYNGQRTPQAYLDAICEVFGDKKPKECSQVLAGATNTPTGSC